MNYRRRLITVRMTRMCDVGTDQVVRELWLAHAPRPTRPCLSRRPPVVCPRAGARQTSRTMPRSAESSSGCCWRGQVTRAGGRDCVGWDRRGAGRRGRRIGGSRVFRGRRPLEQARLTAVVVGCCPVSVACGPFGRDGLWITCGLRCLTSSIHHASEDVSSAGTARFTSLKSILVHKRGSSSSLVRRIFHEKIHRCPQARHHAVHRGDAQRPILSTILCTGGVCRPLIRKLAWPSERPSTARHLGMMWQRKLSVGPPRVSRTL